ncbi:SDR family oxidoreductase [Streptomyces sp. NPDC050560]|uniref:SDR family oxidoreductase n=1 Tax=Streptomyces sp. NPDC050560 TaxID=3365630 RepID=UPI00378A0EC7
MSDGTVLVTGGSGFVAAHCILRLLAAGHTVRTTVRAPERADRVRQFLRTGGAEPGDALGFAVADLTSDEGWAAAMDGCDYVLHTASPFPAGMPRHEDELIVPAREGTLRVLRAARDAGVRRTVLTSSFAAISYGHTGAARTFTEKDWTDVDGPGVSAYAKSKTLAERAAWDFVEREPAAPELAVVNPVTVLGPVLGPGLSTSVTLVQRLLDHDVPALPQLSYSLVDVRDPADLHLRAMTAPAAHGERFLAVSGAPQWIADVARVLRERLGGAAARVPTRRLPNWATRLASRMDPAVRTFVPELGKVKAGSSQKARTLLGWTPRTPEDAIVGTAESLIRLGLVKA